MYNNGISEEYDNPPWEQAITKSISWGNVKNLFATREIAGAYDNNMEAYRALERKRKELDHG